MNKPGVTVSVTPSSSCTQFGSRLELSYFRRRQHEKRMAARATHATPDGSGTGVAKRTSSRNHVPPLARPVPGSMRVMSTDWNGTVDCTPKKLGSEYEKDELISKAVVPAPTSPLEAEKRVHCIPPFGVVSAPKGTNRNPNATTSEGKVIIRGLFKELFATPQLGGEPWPPNQNDCGKKKPAPLTARYEAPEKFTLSDVKLA